jgi:hypothetical protein
MISLKGGGEEERMCIGLSTRRPLIFYQLPMSIITVCLVLVDGY